MRPGNNSLMACRERGGQPFPRGIKWHRSAGSRLGHLGKPRGPAQVFQSWPNDQAGPLSFEGLTRGSTPVRFLAGPGYGRDPVGNGHAAAGFSAVRAPGVAAVDDGEMRTDVIDAAGWAAGLAGDAALLLLLAAVFLPGFFLPAAFFLAVFFTALRFFFDAFFFFFFLPPFLAFFLAIAVLLT